MSDWYQLPLKSDMFWQKKWNVIRSLEFVRTQKPSSGLRGSVGQYWTKPICDDMGEGEFCGIWGGSGVLKTLRGHEVAHSEALLPCLEWCSMCVRWCHLLHASIFMLHARQKGVKMSWKATRENFSNVLPTILSRVILNLFERQEDRERGHKKWGQGWIAKLSKNLSLSLCTETAMWRMQETFS